MSSTSTTPASNTRTTLFAVIVVLAALIGIYHETATAMVRIWARSETFTHAFLVPPISLWLIWEKRHVLARYQPQPSLWIALPIAGLAFAWLLGEVAAVNAVTQLAFTCMIILAVPLMIGVQAARQITFPLAFLLFAVPIGEFVMPMLMDWTAEITVLGLRATGIPVYQEGRHFVIPSGRWSVVEACSGVRYLIASLTVGTIFAYLNYVSLKRRLIFVGVSILVPIVANWVRAYMIVMLGHLSGNEIATGADHLIYGWVFFGVVILIMFAIGMRWSEVDPEATQQHAPVQPVAEAAGTARLGMAAALCIAVIAAPHVVLLALAQGEGGPPPRLDPQQLVRSGWQSTGAPLSGWKPAFKNPSAEIDTTLTNGTQRVGVFLAYYRHQGYQRKLVSSDNMLVTSDDKNWRQLSRATQSVNIGQQPLAVRSGRLRAESPAAPAMVVWHWYWINGRLTANDYLAKAWLAYSRLTGQGDDSAAVFIYAIENNPGDAEAALQAYLAGGGDGIAALLADARRQR